MQKFFGLAGASCVWAALATTHALAGSMALSGNERWLTVASTKDKDTAIVIAGFYPSEHAKVVSTQSEWLAVVLGPYSEGSIEAIKKAHPDIGDLPKDARLSRGEKYIDTIYEQKTWEEIQRLLANYDAKKAVQFAANGINFSVSMEGTEDEPGPTTAIAARDGKTVFSFTTPRDYSMFESSAGLLKLDPGTKDPQLIFTRYTGGAHCCTQTWIATAPEGAAGWTLMDAGMLDGGGYSYEDVDGDGAYEIFNADNSFLYAFNSYAGSFAPIRINQLRGNTLKDVSGEDVMRPQLKRDLARMEFAAKLDPGLWKSNGFLVGWVAAKQRFGQGEDAWQTALENLDPEFDFGPQVCKTGKPIEQCDGEDLERVPIAKALAEFLAERDYGELPPIARALLK